jgi:O-methyltransferase involved in polyketide biosynthesis
MTDHTDINLGGVQKTLLLPLWGRALETKKDNPLLLGQTAVEIITYLQLGTGQ